MLSFFGTPFSSNTVNRAAPPEAIPPGIPALWRWLSLSSCGSLVLLVSSWPESQDLSSCPASPPCQGTQSPFLVAISLFIWFGPSSSPPVACRTPLFLHSVGYVLFCLLRDSWLSSAEAPIAQTIPSETLRIRAKEGGQLSRLACCKRACLLQRMPY